MLVEVIEAFKRKSDGKRITPGEILDIPDDKASALIEKGRVRPTPGGIGPEIRSILADGPIPYEAVRKRLGGATDEQVREAIRPMTDLIGYDDDGVWTWALTKTGRTA